ncbi:MAG TPA: EscU/YscU/HrcU family type III secretion system export apparatus switch protein [Treponemataceae bacterium]|jgi:type III secretion system FlhB-like substrate exporter|nr:EscU/YscU/HrcU family type III secretion system export apparatus switch protein [Treponemataceae bacterium]HOS35544.1 EscU/YscU/HrcU family type III secretion system export apparatus switch protein [Treponemataceae bacterium]HOU38729.1 EscU/YscU/HrcU family type III secretion system export apparatus switch protein [Treponemataceae bacterium]HPL90488.1 EscU/YscU/HrcU family type III secretion system export apparatus switch protein [Treponemataceae bacterium]HQF73215.1 EscU/YscU/HrcU family ty
MKDAAVALSYTGHEPAPVIVASGKNELAKRMREIAREHEIRVVEDPLLADILSDVEIGNCIPGETWEAVAAIFAFFRSGIADELV